MLSPLPQLSFLQEAAVGWKLGGEAGLNWARRGQPWAREVGSGAWAGTRDSLSSLLTDSLKKLRNKGCEGL